MILLQEKNLFLCVYSNTLNNTQQLSLGAFTPYQCAATTLPCFCPTRTRYTLSLICPQRGNLTARRPLYTELRRCFPNNLPSPSPVLTGFLCHCHATLISPGSMTQISCEPLTPSLPPKLFSWPFAAPPRPSTPPPIFSLEWSGFMSYNAGNLAFKIKAVAATFLSFCPPV